jgi:tRNA(Phe) wybutosine-synthesizing methylase Tyw3
MTDAETSGLAYWTKQREKTLSDLATNSNDRSNIGSVDDGILSLVNAVNASPLYYTQSSCSGRVVVFHRLTDASAKKKRGSGRGNVFSSHDPVVDCRSVSESVYDALTSKRGDGEANHDLTHGIVELKFEPVLLHIACRNLVAAQSLLEAATASGLRASGVISMPEVKVNLLRQAATGPADDSGASSPRTAAASAVVDVVPEPGTDATTDGGRSQTMTKVTIRMPTLAIGAKFGFASPLAIGGEVVVGSAMGVEVLLRQANELFVENEARKARLLEAIQQRLQLR